MASFAPQQLPVTALTDMDLNHSAVFGAVLQEGHSPETATRVAGERIAQQRLLQWERVELPKTLTLHIPAKQEVKSPWRKPNYLPPAAVPPAGSASSLRTTTTFTQHSRARAGAPTSFMAAGSPSATPARPVLETTAAHAQARSPPSKFQPWSTTATETNPQAMTYVRPFQEVGLGCCDADDTRHLHQSTLPAVSESRLSGQRNENEIGFEFAGARAASGERPKDLLHHADAAPTEAATEEIERSSSSTSHEDGDEVEEEILRLRAELQSAQEDLAEDEEALRVMLQMIDETVEKREAIVAGTAEAIKRLNEEQRRQKRKREKKQISSVPAELVDDAGIDALAPTFSTASGRRGTGMASIPEDIFKEDEEQAEDAGSSNS